MTHAEHALFRKKEIIDCYSVKKIDIIGIDRSLSSTGIAILRDGKIIHQRELKIKKFGADRLVAIGNAVIGILSKFPGALVCMESYSYNSKGHVFELGELGGVLKAFMHIRNRPYLEVEPTTLKKYVTGKGNADKNLIPVFLLKRFGIEPVGGDAADACGCALLCYHAFKYKSGATDYTVAEKSVFDTFLSTSPKQKKASSKKAMKQLAMEIN